MNYQNYEDYMRSILGYIPNTYSNDNLQNEITQQVPYVMEENTEWYPEIYKIIYPMVQKACNEAQNNDITRDLIDNVTNIIYTNIEVGNIETPELRNGDVINPRAKNVSIRETRGIRPNNPILRDLIKILVIREFFDRRRPPQIRPFPGKHEIIPPFRP